MFPLCSAFPIDWSIGFWSGYIPAQSGYIDRLANRPAPPISRLRPAIQPARSVEESQRAEPHPSPAAISLAQASDFERLLRIDNDCRSKDVIIAQCTWPARPGYHLEASVTHPSLAAVAVLFDYDPAVIAIIDEAQFQRRPVTIDRNAQASRSMRLADDQLDGLSLSGVE